MQRRLTARKLYSKVSWLRCFISWNDTHLPVAARSSYTLTLAFSILTLKPSFFKISFVGRHHTTDLDFLYRKIDFVCMTNIAEISIKRKNFAMNSKKTRIWKKQSRYGFKSCFVTVTNPARIQERHIDCVDFGPKPPKLSWVHSAQTCFTSWFNLRFGGSSLWRAISDIAFMILSQRKFS